MSGSSSLWSNPETLSLWLAQYIDMYQILSQNIKEGIIAVLKEIFPMYKGEWWPILQNNIGRLLGGELLYVDAILLEDVFVVKRKKPRVAANSPWSSLDMLLQSLYSKGAEFSLSDKGKPSCKVLYQWIHVSLTMSLENDETRGEIYLKIPSNRSNTAHQLVEILRILVPEEK
jgi:hypothetical protein